MQFDFKNLSAANRYKLLAATVVPRPIAWVVTQDADGTRNLAPYSFFNAFSEDPPILCIGIGEGGRKPHDEKDTGANIRATGQFVVNLVSAALAEAMNISAIGFAPEIDEIAQAGLTVLPSVRVAPPRIAESPVAFECERFDMIKLSEHRTLVLGRVVAMHVRDDAVRDPERCHIDTAKLDLIGRMQPPGGYVHITDRFTMAPIAPTGWEMK